MVEIKTFPVDRSIQDKNNAPRKAPIPPGIANLTNIFLSILSTRQ